MKNISIIVKWLGSTVLLAIGSACINELTGTKPLDDTDTGLIIMFMICAYSASICFIADVISDMINNKK